MNVRPSILCPIDFSDASAGALRYAASIANHFVTRLIVLWVDDPPLMAMEPGTGVSWTPDDVRREMRQFADKTFGREAGIAAALEYEVVFGEPAPEILRVARERSCDLIVISTRGLTGARERFFGSTTERVLRETTLPVLVTPAHDPGPFRLEDAKQFLGRVIAPVDLSPASRHHAQVAGGIAEALALPLVLVHVVEPLKRDRVERLHDASVAPNRRALAEDALNEMLATVPRRLDAETLVAYGDPAEEVAKVTRDRQAGLIVVGLHGSPLPGPRMGSVTYRLLCLSDTVGLALPPNGHAAHPSNVDRVATARPAERGHGNQAAVRQQALNAVRQ